MTRNSKILLVLGIVIAIVLAVALIQWRDSLAQWLGLSGPSGTLLVSGNIEAHESVLSFQNVQARIVELPFDEGQTVKAGTVLSRVDDADYRQQVAIARSAVAVQHAALATAEQSLAATQKTLLADEADLAQKKLDFDRSEALWKRDYVSTQDRDQARTALDQSAAMLQRDHAFERVAERNVVLARANIKSAEQALKMAEITLGYTALRAPFDGVIMIRQAELGEMAGPGVAIFTLGDLDHVWLRAYVNETNLGEIRLGEPATIKTDTYSGKTYRGRIGFISSQAEFTPKTVETHAERVALVYRIRIDIDNPTHELLPGMPAEATIALLPAGK